jgi:hypothetical protein
VKISQHETVAVRNSLVESMRFTTANHQAIAAAFVYFKLMDRNKARQQSLVFVQQAEQGLSHTIEGVRGVRRR